MKTIDDYLKLPYKMEITEDKDEGGYVISFPDLPGCLSYGDTILKAIENIEDAKKCWFESALDDNIHIPEPNSLDSYSGQFKLRLPRSLHRQLSEQSKKEGISMNQYCIYLLSEKNALYKKHP